LYHEIAFTVQEPTVHDNELEKLKKQQTILYIAIPLTAFQSLMQYLGLFATGTFPYYFGAILSAACAVYAVINAKKIKRLESQ